MTINGTSEEPTDELFDHDQVLSARVQHLPNAFDARKSITSDLQIRCLRARSSLAFPIFLARVHWTLPCFHASANCFYYAFGRIAIAKFLH